jgi:hypothetical protein
MSPTPNYLDLSSRERQIMEVVFRLGRATVADIRAELPDAPTPPAIRTMLARLEEKGCLKHRARGAQNVYAAVVPLARARQERGGDKDRLGAFEVVFRREQTPVCTAVSLQVGVRRVPDRACSPGTPLFVRRPSRHSRSAPASRLHAD